MSVKHIPEIDLPDLVVLTPMQMNAIHFDTGDRSSLADSPHTDSSAPPPATSESSAAS